jgi:hypothetical protein
MLRNYANKHKGPTNVRVREILLQHLAKGRGIWLGIVSRAVIEIDGEQISADLDLKDARRLVEQTSPHDAPHMFAVAATTA